jgi:formylglycine-generating enzyme
VKRPCTASNFLLSRIDNPLSLLKMKTNKKTKSALTILFLALAMIGGIRADVPNAPVIVSLTPNGLLVCTNLSPGSTAAVTWSSSVNGPWLNNLSGLNDIKVTTNGSIQVNVPINSSGMAFYRVLDVPALNPDAGMAFIPAGSFTMGDSAGAIPDAITTNIYLSAFYMDSNLVTYSQWQTVFAFAITNGYSFDNTGSAKDNATNQPIQSVNWWDAVKWCNARSQQAGLMPVYYTDPALTDIYTNGDDTNTLYPNWTANGYQLPTEAQWEKAARGGLSGLRFPWGNTISESQANYEGDTNLFTYDLGPNGYNTNFDSGSEPYTSPVGYFPANGYGLNDMAGNLLEWCWDWYGTATNSFGYGQPSTNNPTGPSSGTFRLTRGGEWGFYANIARTANRSPMDPTQAQNYTGFRCVKNP